MQPIPLDHVRVARPCTAEWKWMYGDDRVRFCSQCNLNVYNLSSMTRDEAEVLILRTEGRLCVRYYCRSDGTVITQDCPTGLEAIKDRRRSTRSRLTRAILGLVAYTAAMVGFGSPSQGIVSTGTPTMGVVALPPDNKSPHTQMPEKEIRKRAILKVDPTCHFSCGKERVIVRIFISQHGFVESSLCSSDNPTHRQLAEQAARAWRFSPVLVGGEAVRVEGTLTMTLH